MVVICGKDYPIYTIQLNLYYEQLIEIPKGIQYLTQLTHLNLSFNKIQEIQYLTQLTNFDIRNNQNL